MARTPLIAGNWKMNLNHFEAVALVQKLAWSIKERELDHVEVALLPPFTDIRSVQTCIEMDHVRFAFGAQDLSGHDAGAYTGEVSGVMLAKLGCSYVVVGHSERRTYHHEDDALINAKVRAALRHGIAPILCVGEGLEVRRAGAHVGHTLAQLTGALTEVSAVAARTIVVAYEPIWAIGTGEVATPADAQEVCGAIRDHLQQLYSAEVADAMRILYGGSVKPDNVATIMAQPDVDGALVGGASIDPEQFRQIVCFRAATPR